MDIIFQSGDFYYENLNNFWSTFGGHLVNLLGVLITGLFAVYLFNKGIEKERRLNKEFRDSAKQDLIEKELIGLEFFKKHFIILTEGVIKNSLKQKDDYQEYANKIIKNPKQQHFPTQRTHENLTRLLKLDTRTLFQLIINHGIEGKAYINFLGNLDYLYEVFQVIPNDIHEGNGKKIIDLSQRLIDVRTEILNTAADFVGKEKYQNKDHLNSPLWNTLNELIIEYYKNNDGIPSVEWDYEKLITQIKEKLLTEEFRYIEISNVLLNLSKTGGDIVFSIVEGNTYLANDILKTCKIIDDVCANVNDLKNKLNNAR